MVEHQKTCLVMGARLLIGLYEVHGRRGLTSEAMQAACEESRAAAERIFILQLLTGQLDPQVHMHAFSL